eukprot:GHVU01150327.1.p1 GENE.GHVU01150327.1~~GHVU01150327.1.p1  ORF type:complete len:246 (-),score=21.17 GHVU01150327.1:207-944(-)
MGRTPARRSGQTYNRRSGRRVDRNASAPIRRGPERGLPRPVPAEATAAPARPRRGQDPQLDVGGPDDRRPHQMVPPMASNGRSTGDLGDRRPPGGLPGRRQQGGKRAFRRVPRTGDRPSEDVGVEIVPLTSDPEEEDSLDESDDAMDVEEEDLGEAPHQQPPPPGSPPPPKDSRQRRGTGPVAPGGAQPSGERLPGRGVPLGLAVAPAAAGTGHAPSRRTLAEVIAEAAYHDRRLDRQEARARRP